MKADVTITITVEEGGQETITVSSPYARSEVEQHIRQIVSGLDLCKWEHRLAIIRLSAATAKLNVQVIFNYPFDRTIINHFEGE